MDGTERAGLPERPMLPPLGRPPPPPEIRGAAERCGETLGREMLGRDTLGAERWIDPLGRDRLGTADRWGVIVGLEGLGLETLGAADRLCGVMLGRETLGAADR